MKKFQFLNISLAPLLLTAVGCVKKAEDTGDPAAAKPAFDLAATESTIQSCYADFEKAFNTKDSVVLANCYTANAKFMSPNEKTVEGRPAIQKTFGMWFQGDMPQIKLSLAEVWGDENAITAENSRTMTDKSGKVVDSGKGIEVYKMENGKWKLFRGCFNSDMPPIPMK